GTMAAGFRYAPGEDLIGDTGFAGEAVFEKILQAARKVKCRALGYRVLVLNVGGIADPADLHPAKEIGLGPRHTIEPCGIELRSLSKNLRIGFEAHLGAAAVQHL